MRIFAACIISLGLFWSACAFADERFTVEIKVDVTDVDAAKAREKAMNSATRAAITAVARRISTSEGADKIAGMTDPQLLNFIKETSVLNEKNSDVRYLADLKIVINEELLKTYMQEREIPLILKTDASVLVIPVFREFAEDTPQLWEVDNPWRQAWENSTAVSAVKFIPIRNSAGNMSALSAEQAAEKDTDALTKVMQMNGVSDLYVLDASYDGVEGLNIKVSSLSGYSEEIKVAGAKSSGEVLFNHAVDTVRRQMEQQILTHQNTIEQQETELTILYPFASLGQWITAEQKIKGLSNVSSMQVQAMAPGKAQFKISYTGHFDTLERQFKAAGYILNDGGNYMILSNIGE